MELWLWEEKYPAFAALIGAPVKAHAVGIANTLFASLDLRDRRVRNDRLDALNNDENAVIEAQTSPYYEADESIDDLPASFVENNPDQFLC